MGAGSQEEQCVAARETTSAPTGGRPRVDLWTSSTSKDATERRSLPTSGQKAGRSTEPRIGALREVGRLPASS